jgi:hypothetical protein
MTAPTLARNPHGDRWFITVMGSNKAQEQDPYRCIEDQQPTFPALSQSDGIHGRPAMAPHGLWFVDDGEHFLAADTLANMASLYSISAPWSDSQGRGGIGCEVAQAPTLGRSPLAAAIMNTGNPTSTLYRGYTNNAGTDDISVFDIDTTPGAESLVKVTIPPPLGNASGNIALTDMTATPMRWAHMPIQCTVSPPNATLHGRYMVVCNKASFNVSIIALDPDGNPTGIYTFPAGLGAHGVGYGRKRSLTGPGGIAYYAYVTNTFENYVSVYDLELLEKLIELEKSGQAPPEFLPGGATEQVFVEGYAAQLLTGQNSVIVPVTVFSPDARGLVHVGDIPLSTPTSTNRSYLQEHVMVDVPGFGETLLDLDLRTDTGAMGVFCSPLPPPWRED